VGKNLQVQVIPFGFAGSTLKATEGIQEGRGQRVGIRVRGWGFFAIAVGGHTSPLTSAHTILLLY
jgi:hypothetical protein